MRKNLSIALTLLALVGAAPLLGACHTTAGAGQDLSATGHVLTNSAQKSHAVSIVEENRLAKGRSSRNREAKKPKGGKQPTQAASSFLRPQPASSKPAPKESTK